MKKIIFLALLYALCSSCDKEPELPIETLADSVSTHGSYSMVGEWIFDGVVTELTQENSIIDIWAETETHISLSCGVIFPHENTMKYKYRIETGRIPLSGEPGNVSFDHSRNVTFSEMFSETVNTVYDPIPATIRGWIKRTQPSTRLGPKLPMPFDCEIMIEYEVDGKPLRLHITRMNFY